MAKSAAAARSHPQQSRENSIEEEETRQDLENQLASLMRRKESISEFTDPSMRKLQLSWVERDIEEVQQKLDLLDDVDGEESK